MADEAITAENNVADSHVVSFPTAEQREARNVARCVTAFLQGMGFLDPVNIAIILEDVRRRWDRRPREVQMITNGSDPEAELHAAATWFLQELTLASAQIFAHEQA